MKHALPALALLAFLAAAACASAQEAAPAAEPAPAETAALPEPGGWFTDFGQARAAAAEKHLPMFLNFTGSDWCPWCVFADEQVFSLPEWKSYAAGRVVPVFVDFPHEKPMTDEQRAANQALADRFDVDGYPTFVVLAEDGETVLGTMGVSRGMSFFGFVSQLERVLAGLETE